MMKRILLFAAISLLLPVGFAQTTDQKPPADAPKEAVPAEPKQTEKELVPADTNQDDSPLVRAAKANKANKKKTTSRIVINNEDVKNSKGKLILITEKPVDPNAPPPPLPDDRKKPKPPLAEATQKYEAARKEVADLEKEMARLEDDFYNEDDLAYREGVISNRFEQARKQLETARQKLLDAREAYQQLERQAATRRSENP